MDRAIEYFVQDGDAAWIAHLACGHRQHMRHAPPLTERPWVLRAEGRAARIGHTVNCPLCDALEVPAGARTYRSTPVFDANTLPQGLRRDHSTKKGVWARVRVFRGCIRYVVHEPLARREMLSPDRHGVVAPQVMHHLEVVGAVSLQIDFLRV